MLFYGKLFLALLLKSLCVNSAVDYCDQELCRPGLLHVACNNDRKFQTTCPKDAGIIQMTPTLQKFILDKHNEKRDFIAGGSEQKLKPACRMATMQWSIELAKLAELNVRKCIVDHDQCINTPDFKNAGQNLCFQSFFKPLKVQPQIQAALDEWYNEMKLVTMEQILDYKEESKETTGNFTTMMIDNNERVGCAMAQYSIPNMKSRGALFTCNYAVNNIVGQPTWKSCSNATEECKKGFNKNFKNLCTIAEPYEP